MKLFETMHLSQVYVDLYALANKCYKYKVY